MHVISRSTPASNPKSVTGAQNPLADSFRSAMAAVCTPVSVVTTIENGRPHGTTVSAFASLSMSPPMILVSLDGRSELLSIIQRTGQFGVNILSSAQSELAQRFAAKGATKFDNVSWTEREGLPRLDNSNAWISCSVSKIVDGGDHQIVLGSVLAADVYPGEPLTYHARTFGTHLSS